MSKYISAKYIEEKMRPIENLITIVKESKENNISDKVSNSVNEIAFAFAVIAKELGVEIPIV